MSTFIFTFYSFKGGVGRTMAMLNVGYCLASWGRNVLMLDMDLEAPGLSGFLATERANFTENHHDMIDVVAWARERATEAGEEWLHAEAIRSGSPCWEDTVVNLMDATTIPEQLRPRLGEAGRLDAVPIHERRSHVKRLTALRLGDLADDREAMERVSNLLRAYVKLLRFPVAVPEYWGPEAPRNAAYDYVLVDSRTGLTEIGGLCVGPLADRLVVLTSLNEQSIEGTRHFLKTVGIQPVDPIKEQWDRDDPAAGDHVPPRIGPKPTLIVASPVPGGEIERREERCAQVAQRLGEPAVLLPYHPQVALAESAFVRDFPGEHLTTEYRKLADLLTAAVNDHPTQIAQRSSEVWNEGSAQAEAIEEVLGLTAQRPDVAELLLKRLADHLTPKSEHDSRVAVRLHSLMAQSSMPERWVACAKLALTLARWASLASAPSVRDGRTAAAIDACTEVTQMPDAPNDAVARAYVNRGSLRERRGYVDGAIADFSHVIDAGSFPPDEEIRARVARGVTYGKSGQVEAAIADFTRVIEMPSAAPVVCARAYANRAEAKRRKGDLGAAIADLTSALEILAAPLKLSRPGPDVSTHPHAQGSDAQSVKAHVEVGPLRVEDDLHIVASESGHQHFAIGQKRVCLELRANGVILEVAPSGDSSQLRASLLVRRGDLFKIAGDMQKALADFSAAMAVGEAPVVQKALAQYNRAVLEAERGNRAQAMSDYSDVLSLAEIPAGLRARALINRGVIRRQLDDIEGAMIDYEAVLSLTEHVGEASAWPQGSGDAQGALPGHPADGMDRDLVESRGMALVNVGMAYQFSGDLDAAITSYDRVIEMAGVSAVQKGRALINRGVIKMEQGDVTGGIADLDQVLSMEEATPDLRGDALINRGVDPRQPGASSAAPWPEG